MLGHPNRLLWPPGTNVLDTTRDDQRGVGKGFDSDHVELGPSSLDLLPTTMAEQGWAIPAPTRVASSQPITYGDS